MKITIVSDFKICIFEDRVFVSNKAYLIIKRYFESFGRVFLCTREDKIKMDKNWHDATDILEGVLTFRGWRMLFSRKFTISLGERIKSSDLVVGRFESFAALKAYKIAKKFNKPFLAEVMSCAWDGLWNHGLVGKIVAPYAYFKTKRAIKNANYALYVTEHFLQKRYPCLGITTNVSNVFLSDVSEDVLNKRIEKISNSFFNEITLITVAATYVRYKGQQFVIKSIPLFNRIGIRVKYLIVGEGDQQYLKKIAKKSGVFDQVVFTGRKSLEEIYELIDNSDIYIQPSLQEGLPRALIEALSRSCPSCGTKTAGIPELLNSELLFKKKSPHDIFKCINKMLTKDKLTNFARNGFEIAKLYKNDTLDKRRKAFFKTIMHNVCE